jgi:hypothetical protein
MSVPLLGVVTSALVTLLHLLLHLVVRVSNAKGGV